MSKFDTLQAWCQWKLREKDLRQEDRELVKDIQDLISEVGTWKAKCKKLEEKLNEQAGSPPVLRSNR